MCFLNVDHIKHRNTPLLHSLLQEEARVSHLEHQRDDSAGRASGDPQHRQRHRDQWQRPGDALPGPRPLRWGAGHLWGPLPERRLEPHRPHCLFLLHHAATAQTQNPNACPGKPWRCSLKSPASVAFILLTQFSHNDFKSQCEDVDAVCRWRFAVIIVVKGACKEHTILNKHTMHSLEQLEVLANIGSQWQIHRSCHQLPIRLHSPPVDVLKEEKHFLWNFYIQRQRHLMVTVWHVTWGDGIIIISPGQKLGFDSLDRLFIIQFF